MRGRTLREAFIIMDEGQNTTIEQMKMFLTRLGFGSKAVVNGDLSQIDLPKSTISGLKHSIEVLKDVKSIKFTKFGAKDVIRHSLVQEIVQAYDNFE
jgi:phosphate starvation-inducible PhoH-like protein